MGRGRMVLRPRCPHSHIHPQMVTAPACTTPIQCRLSGWPSGHTSALTVLPAVTGGARRARARGQVPLLCPRAPSRGRAGWGDPMSSGLLGRHAQCCFLAQESSDYKPDLPECCFLVSMETPLPLFGSGWLAGPRRSTSRAFSAMRTQAGGGGGWVTGQRWAGGKRAPKRWWAQDSELTCPPHYTGQQTKTGGWGEHRPWVTALLGPAGKWDCVVGTWPETHQSCCPRHRKPRVRVSAHRAIATGMGFPPASPWGLRLCLHRSLGGVTGGSPLWPVTRRGPGCCWPRPPLPGSPCRRSRSPELAPGIPVHAPSFPGALGAGVSGLRALPPNGPIPGDSVGCRGEGVCGPWGPASRLWTEWAGASHPRIK